MQTNNKNKMIGETDAKNKELKKEDFFFAGGLEYLPQTIKAESREEAEKIWLESRKKQKAALQNN
jgi:hypothetical protein